jgi:O-methyltransferase involved in polyketide biosynthesis
MPEKLTIKLGNISKTLLLPLWGRAIETQKPYPFLVDKTAVNIIDRIDYDFSMMANNISYLTQLAWIGRSKLTDKTIKKFLQLHPEAAIVNIGCGLDTTFERVNNGKLYWYDLDLPEVIELRRNFIQETDRRKFITSSFLDYSWFRHLKVKENVMFIAAGVFYYFEEDQIRNFIINIAESFPGSEILFDVASPFGVKVSNKHVIQNSGMDKNSFLKWGIKNHKEIQLWDKRIKVLKKYSFFKDLRRGLTFKERLGTYFSDLLKVMYMVHIKFQ